uniref:Aminotransferase class I/classII large domain-containing protein n=1 Tax=Phasianus colchicus TaxID=9054 RepID=A0A669QPT0_PHACC
MSGGGGVPARPVPALSARGARIAAGVPGLLDGGFALYVADPFDRERNPEGVVNLGTSENRLCFDLIEERVTLCMIVVVVWLPHSSVLNLNHRGGGVSVKEHLFCFFQITVMNGCCAVFATLSTVLCDPGGDFPWKGTVCSCCILQLQFGVTAVSHCWFFFFQGIRVRVLVLINPNNPLGDIYPAQLLKECLEFAHRHELHVIMDEIYMLSVYDDTTFTSVLSLDSLPDLERTHFMWGFSKDFGMSGIRVGVLYTRNHEIQKAVNQLAVFHSCPGPVQHILTQVLKDRDWLDNVFFPTNKKRLKEAQNLLVDGLADIGIPVLKSSGGLFVWADFRKFLKSQTFEAELELWQKLLDKKLLISPGKAFYCHEPGWFRLVFSDSVDKIYLCKLVLLLIHHVVACKLWKTLALQIMCSNLPIPSQLARALLALV